MRISGWGNYPSIEARLKTPATAAEIEKTIRAAEGRSVIGRGLGRCYGDSALNGELTLSSLRLDSMISFDQNSGVLVAEAGLSLAEIVETFLPRGWFPPVTPGTKFVTLGGAVASDVHGKNHHLAGCFSQHVLWLDLWTPAAGLVRCSPAENEDLFRATCGGHGLTGFIVRAAVRLAPAPSAYIAQKLIKTADLAEIMNVFETQGALPFSVAWIDCLKAGRAMGRSIFMGGDFARPEELGSLAGRPLKIKTHPTLAVPFNFPSFALNSFSIRAFNFLYYSKNLNRESKSLVGCDKFYYPLDAVNHWNRIYGRRGFLQYQFVLPKESAAKGLPKIMSRLVDLKAGSFLAVLKLFGDQPVFEGNISFPKSGYTLALDFPISDRLLKDLERIDDLVVDYGGRFYLTKDSRMSAAVFARGYGAALDKFREVKARWDPDNLFRSHQSDRLGLTQ